MPETVATNAPVRCWRCGNRIAEELEKGIIVCDRCHARNQKGY